MHAESKLTLVIGLGEIGRPLYEQLARAGRTRGVDVDPVTVTEPVGIMHVCYPFGATDDFVATTEAYVREYAPELVVVNSTVEPGTCRSIEQRAGVPVVSSPIRGKHTRMAEDLLRYRKFVAGSDAAAVERVREHFAAAGFQVAVMERPEALELAKLSETTYFGLLIAWAQELERFSRDVGADYYEVNRFFEEIDYLPRVVFRPGHIGGHCIMPNIAILKRRFQSRLLDAVVHSNEIKAHEVEVETGPDRQRLVPLQPGERPRR